MEMGKTPADLFRERVSRVEDAIQLKEPDRVPIAVNFGFFAARYTGLTLDTAYYDYDRWTAANKKLIVDLEPEMFHMPESLPGPVLEALDCKLIKWPGHDFPGNQTFQFVEGEYMAADEYDAFLNDPSDFAIRTFLPRAYGNLQPFRMLPHPSLMMFGYRRCSLFAVLERPEIAGLLESLLQVARRASEWQKVWISFLKEMEELGFPLYTHSYTLAPFDILSDFLRGMKGTMLDMYRQPDKIIAACEKLLPMMIDMALSTARRAGNPRVFIPLHRGADGFMSLKQFEAFYWPTLKRMMIALIDEGLTPCPFFEGSYDMRLEYLKELPRGKVLGHFDRTDIFKAKQIIGDHMCIMGNVPLSLLCAGTPQEVKDYCRRLIDVVGKGGGFILSPGVSLDDARVENVIAMFEVTREYGKYS